MLGEKEIFGATLITHVETLKISSESHMTTGVKKKIKETNPWKQQQRSREFV